MSITKEQLAETANKLFEGIDTNNNGKLEKSEVRTFSMEMMKVLKPNNFEWDEEKFEANFEKLDKNEDGTICREELFLSLYEKAQKKGALADSQWMEVMIAETEVKIW